MKFSNISGLSDSHMHFSEMIRKKIDIDDFINNWNINNGNYLIDIGIDENNFEKRLELATTHNNILLTAGIHPNCCSGDLAKRVSMIDKQLENSYVIGVGETGLDYFREFTDKHTQKKFFEKHIELSIKHNKPLIVHNRDSSNDILSILSNYKGEVRGVIHCFSEGPQYLEKFLELGFYISYAGNVTYKKSTNIQESLLNTPLDKLLIETDSPYLTPQKVRGRTNTPGYIGYTLDFICDNIKKNREVVLESINKNFNNIFKIQG